MDALIDKGNNNLTYASELNLLVKDIKVSNATLEQNNQSIKGSSRSIDNGATYSNKSIVIEAWGYSKNEYDFSIHRDLIYSVFADRNPFYISEVYSLIEAEFQRPGESEGYSLLDLSKGGFNYRQRYKVRLDGDISYSFEGKNGKGMIASVEIPLITVELPFGESEARDTTVKADGKVNYEGSTDCNQLESPFVLRATALKAGTDCNFTIQDRTLTYKGNYSVNDVFNFAGSYNTLNEVNINDKTNYQYFIFNPSVTKFNRVYCSKPTDFKLEVLGLKNLYV